MTEARYQARLIRRLKRRFPGCIVLKNDPQYLQGVPDLVIFWGMCWAMLEVKPTPQARERPNQRYFIKQLNQMSFAAFICPENEEEVLLALQEAFSSHRSACFPQSEHVPLD